MGRRERAAVQLPAAAMVLTVARVLLITLAALGASGQGQITLGKLPPPLRCVPDPQRDGTRGSPGVMSPWGLRDYSLGACGVKKAGSVVEAQETEWASGVPLAAV